MSGPSHAYSEQGEGGKVAPHGVNSAYLFGLTDTHDAANEKEFVTGDLTSADAGVHPFDEPCETKRDSISEDRNTKQALSSKDKSTRRASSSENTAPDWPRSARTETQKRASDSEGRNTKRTSVIEERKTKWASGGEDRNIKRASISEDRNTKRASGTEDRNTKRASGSEDRNTKRASFSEDINSKHATSGEDIDTERISIREDRNTMLTSISEGRNTKRISISEDSNASSSEDVKSEYTTSSMDGTTGHKKKPRARNIKRVGNTPRRAMALVMSCLRRLLPESPRWLATRGRLVEAIEVLTRAAIANGRPLPSREQLMTAIVTIHDKNKKEFRRAKTKSSDRQDDAPVSCNIKLRMKLNAIWEWHRDVGSSVYALMSTPLLACVTIVMFYLWFTAAFTYYGISLYSVNLK
ncbi:hypothetical protein O3P69_004694 [Scylla paramamosain]|uniref:Uncharacterized protein n=1 Tax=Scylla paramamosain TaxID=85552 RepID=A0AAW0UAP2_SCYPA